MRIEHRRLLLQAAFWCCLVAVALLALRPPQPQTVPGWDKVNHLFAFGVLGLLGLSSWRKRTWQVLVGLVAYGCLIEVLQSFTPDRQADWRDLVANTAGLLLSLLAVRPLRKWL